MARFSRSSPLLNAIRSGSLIEVTRVLEAGADIEEADIHGHRGLPLRTACFEGRLEIVGELLRRGANINAAGGDGPGMPLRAALRACHPAVVQFLLEHGAEMPPDVRLDATISNPPAPNLPAESEPAPLQAAPARPTSSFTPAPSPPRPAQEQPPPEHDPWGGIEEIDLSACYGVDTNVLEVDLQHLRNTVPSSDAPVAPPPQGNTPFWKKAGR